MRDADNGVKKNFGLYRFIMENSRDLRKKDTHSIYQLLAQCRLFKKRCNILKDNQEIKSAISIVEFLEDQLLEILGERGIENDNFVNRMIESGLKKIRLF